MLTAAMMSALALSAQAVSAVPGDRSDQWLSREVSGQGTVVSFLSWDFTSVITQARCDDGRITFQYFHEAKDAPSPTDRPLALLVDDTSYRLDPSVDRMSRQVYTLSREGVVALTNARNVDLDAPNEMGEPWYMGPSAALVRLAGNCG